MSSLRTAHACRHCDSLLDCLDSLESHVTHFHRLSFEWYKQTFPDYNVKVEVAVNRRSDFKPRPNQIQPKHEVSNNPERSVLKVIPPALEKQILALDQARDKLQDGEEDENRIDIAAFSNEGSSPGDQGAEESLEHDKTMEEVDDRVDPDPLGEQAFAIKKEVTPEAIRKKKMELARNLEQKITKWEALLNQKIVKKEVKKEVDDGSFPNGCRVCIIDNFEDKGWHAKKYRSLHKQGCHKLYPCDHCNVPFRSQYHLIRHRDSHKKEKPDRSFRCALCEKPFSCKKARNKHEIDVHASETDGWLLKCNICDKRFQLTSQLEKHMVSEHESTGKKSNIRVLV